MPITVANTGPSNTFDYLIDRTNEIAEAMSTKVVTVDSNSAVGNASVNGTFSSWTMAVNTAIHGGIVGAIAALPITSNVIVTGDIFTMGSGATNSVANTSAYLFSNSSFSSKYSIDGVVSGNSVANVNITPTSFSLSNSTFSLSIVPSQVSVGNSSVNTTIDQFSGIGNYVNVATTGTTEQIVDSYPISVLASDYSITIEDAASNSYHFSKVAILNDGSATPPINEYSVMVSNATAGVLGTFSANANTTHIRLLCTPAANPTQIKLVRVDVRA